MMRVNGFYEHMPFDEYAAIDALNYSSVKHMMRSPMSYLWHKQNPQPPTDAMQLGTAAHRAILEPERVGDFAVWVGGRRYGKEWDGFCADNHGKQILTKAEYDHVVGISVAVRRNRSFMRYLAPTGKNEIVGQWTCPETGRKMKARFDRTVLVGKQPYIFDLKSTRDCRPFRFGNEAYRLGYHLQFALYQDGFLAITGELPKVVVGAVENKPPYESVLYTVPEDVLLQGHADYINLVRQITECEQTCKYPPALESETTLTLPTYAYGEEADDLSDLGLVAE